LRQSKWRLLLFPSPVSPFLWPMSPHCLAISHFLPKEPRWAHYLRCIFRQCFIPSSPLSNRNRSIESTPPPLSTLPGPPGFHPHCYKKVIPASATLPTTQPRLHFVSSLAKHHIIGAPPNVIVPFHCRPTPIVPPYNDTHSDELANPLSLHKPPRWGPDHLSCLRTHLRCTMSSSPLQVHGGPTPCRGPRSMHEVHKISNIETILEFQENPKTLHLAPLFFRWSTKWKIL
jgi:hypothetical protein